MPANSSRLSGKKKKERRKKCKPAGVPIPETAVPTETNLEEKRGMQAEIKDVSAPEAANVESAVTSTSTNAAEERWYSPTGIENLSQLMNVKELLPHVFLDVGYSSRTSFESQFEVIMELNKALQSSGQPVKGICFIGKEPGVGQNHYVIGILMGTSLIIINPIGITKHRDFYETMSDIQSKYGLTINLSATILQKEEGALIHCGPICIELMYHISQLSIREIVSTTSIRKKHYERDHFFSFDVLPILPKGLSALVNAPKDEYEKLLTEIRENHKSALSTDVTKALNKATQTAINVSLGSDDNPKSRDVAIRKSIDDVIRLLRTRQDELLAKKLGLEEELRQLEIEIQAGSLPADHSKRTEQKGIQERLVAINMALAEITHPVKASGEKVRVAASSSAKKESSGALTNQSQEVTKRLGEAMSSLVLKGGINYYGTDDVTEYVDLIVEKELRGFKYRANELGQLFRQRYLIQHRNPDANLILITPAIDTAGEGLSIDHFLDKGRQERNTVARILEDLSIDALDKSSKENLHKQLTAKFIHEDKAVINIVTNILWENQFDTGKLRKEIHERDLKQGNVDVFDELMPSLFKLGRTGTAKILFPYNVTNVHWLAGEIRINREGNNYNIEVYAHDPYGGGKMRQDNYEVIKVAIEKKIEEEHVKQHRPRATITCNNKVSSYGRRQAQGDSVSCGVIVAEDIIKLVKGESLNIDRPHETGTRELRSQHIARVKQSADSKKMASFIRRNTIGRVVHSAPKPKVSNASLGKEEINEIFELIQSIKNQDLKEGIVKAITDKLDEAYLTKVRTAIEQLPMLLSSQGVMLEDQDIDNINKTHRLLFNEKGKIKGDASLIQKVGIGWQDRNRTEAGEKERRKTEAKEGKGGNGKDNNTAYEFSDIGASVSLDIRSNTLERFQEITECLSKAMPVLTPKGVNKYIIAEYAAQDYSQLEYQVAAQLKEAMRENNVKDWYKAICVLGEIYRKRQEYTKSTALYNYAINLCKVKKEEVQEWENKIEEIRLILAEIENEFIESINCNPRTNPYSYLAVNDSHKNILQELRSYCNADLKRLDKLCSPEEASNDEPKLKELELLRANEIEKLYSSISHRMKEFIRELLDECKQVLGVAPCNYAIIGLGSLARSEITPYSDFEWAILIEDEKDKRVVEGNLEAERVELKVDYRVEAARIKQEKNKQYFRKLTRLMHLKVINLGETVLPCMAIDSLNQPYPKDPLDDWFFDQITPNGFKFDGNMPRACKTPLGKTAASGLPEGVKDPKGHTVFELIHTPEKMAEFQCDKWFEEDNFLPNELVTAVWLYGDDKLVTQYRERIKCNLLISEGLGTIREKRSVKLLQQDLISYDTKIMGQSEEGKLYNVKKEIYRLPDRIIDGLALYYGLDSTSGWYRINEMYDKGIINTLARDNLKIAVSIAIEFRLRSYLKNNGQYETMSIFAPISQLDIDQQVATIKDAFLLPMTFSIENSLLFRFYYTVLPLHICISELCKKLSIKSDPSLVQHIFRDAKFFDNSYLNRGMIYKRLLQYEEAIRCFKKAVDQGQVDIEKEALSYQLLAQTYNAKGQYRQAIYYYTKYMELQNTHNKCGVARHDINLLALYENEGNIAKTLPFLMKVIKRQGANNHELLANVATTLASIGEYEKSIEIYQFIKANASLAFRNLPQYIIVLSGLGKVLFEYDQFDKAQEEYKALLPIIIKHYGNTHPLVAHYYNDLANVLLEKGNVEGDNLIKAQKCYRMALLTLKAIYNGKHPDIVMVINNIGRLESKKGNYDEAIFHHKEAQGLLYEIYGNNDTIPSDQYLISLMGHANALAGRGSLDEAEPIFERIMVIIEAKRVIPKAGIILTSYADFIQFLLKDKRFKLAEEYINKYARILNAIYPDNEYNIHCISYYISLSQLLFNYKHYEQAKNYLKKTKEITAKLIGTHCDAYISILTLYAGCFYRLDELEEAKRILMQAEEIVLKMNPVNKQKLTIVEYNMAKVLYKLGEYDKAISYFTKLSYYYYEKIHAADFLKNIEFSKNELDAFIIMENHPKFKNWGTQLELYIEVIRLVLFSEICKWGIERRIPKDVLHRKCKEGLEEFKSSFRNNFKLSHTKHPLEIPFTILKNIIQKKVYYYLLNESGIKEKVIVAHRKGLKEIRKYDKFEDDTVPMLKLGDADIHLVRGFFSILFHNSPVIFYDKQILTVLLSGEEMINKMNALYKNYNAGITEFRVPTIRNAKGDNYDARDIKVDAAIRSQTSTDNTVAHSFIKISSDEEALQFNQKGAEHFRKGDYLTAIQVFSQSISIKPTAENLFNRGRSYYKISNFADAIKDYQKVLKINPKHAKAYCHLGLCYQQNGDHKRAKICFKLAIAKDPNFELAQTSLKAMNAVTVSQRYWRKRVQDRDRGVQSQALERAI